MLILTNEQMHKFIEMKLEFEEMIDEHARQQKDKLQAIANFMITSMEENIQTKEINDYLKGK